MNQPKVPQPIDPNNQHLDSNPVGRFMVAAGAIVQRSSDHKILVVQRANNLDWHPGEWEITYGRLDQFESAQEGLRRELSEETGLRNVQVRQVLRVWHIFRGSRKPENDLIGITFYCVVDDDQVTLSSEHQTYRWVEPKEALSLVKVEGIREDIITFEKLSQS